MSDFEWSAGYIDNTGVLVAHEHYKSTEKIKTVAGTTITFTNLRAPANFYPAIACYSGGTYDNNSSAMGNDYTSYKSGTFTVPSGIDEVAFVTYYNDDYPVNVTMTVLEPTVDILSDTIDAITESVESIEEDMTITLLNKADYSDTADYTAAYLDTNGGVVSYANSYVSDYIPVIAGDSIKCKLAYIYGVCIAAAFYKSDKTFISGSAIVADSGSAGSWTYVDGTYTVPSNAAYMRFSMSKDSRGGITYSEQFVEWNGVKSLKSFVVDDISPNAGEQWRGKSWCCFGTSITDTSYTDPGTGEVTGKYVPFLKDYSGLAVTNRGIAGGTLGSGGIHGGSSNILNAILNSNDLDDFDLITIEGFVNDFACAISIGNIGDTQNTTFYGALHQAISYCLSNSHAEVVLITETTGKVYELSGGGTADYTILHKNSLDLYQQAYNDAMIRIGQYYGVHVIDAGGKSQINQYHPEYIIDQIHHTTLGGEQYAKTIWEELKNITPAII